MKTQFEYTFCEVKFRFFKYLSSENEDKLSKFQSFVVSGYVGFDLRYNLKRL